MSAMIFFIGKHVHDHAHNARRGHFEVQSERCWQTSLNARADAVAELLSHSGSTRLKFSGHLSSEQFVGTFEDIIVGIS